MDSTESCNAGRTQAGAAAPTTLNQEIASKRQELARLIGRLLARHWLKGQRGSNQDLTAEEASDEQTGGPA